MSSEEVRRFYDESSHQWLIDDAVLGELDDDVQRIIECSNEHDLILFETHRTIKPNRTLLISTNLTLTRCDCIPLPKQAPRWLVFHTCIASLTKQFLECSQNG